MGTQVLQDKANPAVTIGFWSALLTSLLNLWFYIAFVPYQSTLHASWQGIAAYAAAFQPLPFLAWVIPVFLLAPTFLIAMTCLHASTREDKQIWTLLAVVFAVGYAALLSALYYIQMTVVLHNLARGNTEGLSLWLFADSYPYSVPGALEGTGYGFMSLAFLFAAQAFGTDKLQKWLRWTFLGAGLTGLVVFTDPLFPLPTMFIIVDAIASAVFLTVAPILLAIWFRRTQAGLSARLSGADS